MADVKFTTSAPVATPTPELAVPMSNCSAVMVMPLTVVLVRKLTGVEILK